MMAKPRILLFCRTYLPGHRAGGPVRTLSNLVECLGDEFDFYIATLDRDFGVNEPFPGIRRDAFQPVGKAKVRYFAPEDVNYGSINRLVAEVAPQILYLNSIMDQVFTPKVLKVRKRGEGQGIPTILAVRGQFNPGAMALRGLSKRIYISWLKLRGLLDGLIWQATGTPEDEAIRKVLGQDFLDSRSAGVFVAPNISHAVAYDPEKWVARSAGQALRVALLGRVSPMKNIDYAIEVMGKIPRPAELTLYGPVEDEGYWRECKAKIAELPEHIRVIHGGAVSPTQIHETLAAHDCFFLPTRGENFGHAIAEALSAGLPAVISDQTPWRDLADAGVGAALPLNDQSRFVAELDRLAALSADEMRELHQTCASYAKQAVSQPSILAANRALFHDNLPFQQRLDDPSND